MSDRAKNLIFDVWLPPRVRVRSVYLSQVLKIISKITKTHLYFVWEVVPPPHIEVIEVSLDPFSQKSKIAVVIAARLIYIY